MRTLDITAAQKYTHFCDLLKAGNDPDKFNLNVEAYGYFDAICTVKSLLRTVADMADSPNNDKEALLFQARTIVELCISMLPINEMEYLDKILIDKPEKQ